ncbi:MAG TPA: hypothetical protein VFV99_23410 [Kofleriaceae bacterium]|nr:hypothetical protein [Kofleriaceae bacterium]
MDTLTIARQLADFHPSARLPCPACGVSVNGDNLAKHLAKVHADFSSLTPPWRGRGWFGLLPASIAFDGDAIVLRRLGQRRVSLPCKLEVGTLVGTRPDAISANQSVDYNTPGETVRVGRYLRLVGDRSITIGCRSATQFHAHWRREQLIDGGRRRSCHVMLSRPALAAIEYELARRGMLVPQSQ